MRRGGQHDLPGAHQRHHLWGTPTGAVLSYDKENRLVGWQNAPSNPTSTASFAYDGEGQRVAQNANGTKTYYVGGAEEQTGSTLTRYCMVPGLPTAMNVGRHISYLANDGISSASEALDGSSQGKLPLPRMWRNPGVDIAASGDYI